MAAADLTAARLRESIHYNPETGVFTWIKHRKRTQIGTEGGSIHSVYGYRYLTVGGSRNRCNRLACLYMTGRWPLGVVDHINGNRLDDRWENLRDVSHSVNTQNQRRAMAGSASGLLGVSKANSNRWKGVWRAIIRVNGKQIHLGVFDSELLAHEAYVNAKRLHHAGCTI